MNFNFENTSGKPPESRSMSTAIGVPTLFGEVIVPLICLEAVTGGAPVGAAIQLWATVWANDYPGYLVAATAIAQCEVNREKNLEAANRN